MAAAAADFKKCVQKSFSDYTSEKAMRLLQKRYNPDVVPLGFLMYLQLVQHDVRTGVDGFSGEKFQASPIVMLPHEMVAFAAALKGEEYAAEVAKILEELSVR